MANKSKKSATKTTKVSRVTATKPVEKPAPKAAKDTGNFFEKHFKNRILPAISSPANIVSLFAEFFGTFIFALGVLAIGTLAPLLQSADIFLVTILSGFMLAIAVFTVGKVSGGHLNPAITAGAFATRRIGYLRAVGYIVFQIAGAMAAFLILQAFLGQLDSGTQTAKITSVSSITEKQLWGIFFAELLGASIFTFSVAQISAQKDAKNSTLALAAGGGLSVALLISLLTAGIVGGKVILNPAVAFSLQAFTAEDGGTLRAIAVYVCATVLGGVIGFVISTLLSKFSEK